MAETTDAFSPLADLVGKMVFFIVLLICLILIVGFLVMSFKKPKARNYGPIENNIIANVVSDTIKHKPVKNQHLDCPDNPLKYSYTFFLNIDDYYCNRGYWKCIMIKGSEVTEEGTRCTSTVKSLTESGGTGDCNNDGLIDHDKQEYSALELKDLYRVLSFFGLGISLIGLSYVYTRFVK